MTPGQAFGIVMTVIGGVIITGSVDQATISYGGVAIGVALTIIGVLGIFAGRVVYRLILRRI